MVTRPHYIEYVPLMTLPEGEEWVDVQDIEPVLLQCRMEPQGGKEFTETEDGTLITYSDIVYLDADVPKAAYGSEVRIFADEAKTNLLGTRTVKRFFPGQINTRIWV